MRNGSFATAAWVETLSRITSEGVTVSPRGMKTLELQHHTVQLNMNYPVVSSPVRKLSYTFLAAEALWILAGDDRVETIAPYNPNIAAFSDDGHRFYGAYGPRIMDQFDWVLEKLWEDRDTRQAVMTTWRQKPPKTKDVPCTVAIAFSIRRGRLHCHVFMRSSDAWLGLPYDVFNFSMLSAKLACYYNHRVQNGGVREKVELGWLHLTAASSHLYEKNFKEVEKVLEGDVLRCEPVPDGRILYGEWSAIEMSLIACRDKTEDTPIAGRILPWRIR